MSGALAAGNFARLTSRARGSGTSGLFPANLQELHLLDLFPPLIRFKVCIFLELLVLFVTSYDHLDIFCITCSLLLSELLFFADLYI